MARTTPFKSFAEQLLVRLDGIEENATEIVRCATITSLRTSAGGFMVIATGPHGWAPISPRARPSQERVLREFPLWMRSLRSLLLTAASDVQKRVKKEEDLILVYVDHVGRHDSIPETVPQAVTRLRQSFATLREVLVQRRQGSPEDLVVIPDTNALTDQPDVSRYGPALGADTYRVVLTPTVLGELDKLKVDAKSSEYREKVQAVIKRIKGWRIQGDLSSGTRAGGGAIVQSVAFEPRVKEVHASLDPESADDRLLASALEHQANEPGSVVVLMTRDVNLQNKAAAMGFPYVETPIAVS